MFSCVPNITGSFATVVFTSGNPIRLSGVFTTYWTGSDFSVGTGETNAGDVVLYASNYSSLYKDNSTVQPYSIRYLSVVRT